MQWYFTDFLLIEKEQTKPGGVGQMERTSWHYKIKKRIKCKEEVTIDIKEGLEDTFIFTNTINKKKTKQKVHNDNFFFENFKNFLSKFSKLILSYIWKVIKARKMIYFLWSFRWCMVGCLKTCMYTQKAHTKFFSRKFTIFEKSQFFFLCRLSAHTF